VVDKEELDQRGENSPKHREESHEHLCRLASAHGIRSRRLSKQPLKKKVEPQPNRRADGCADNGNACKCFEKGLFHGSYVETGQSSLIGHSAPRALATKA
jgi:hypothetical protein